LAHTLEPAAIRAGQRLIHGRGTGALQRPLEYGGPYIIHTCT